MAGTTTVSLLTPVQKAPNRPDAFQLRIGEKIHFKLPEMYKIANENGLIIESHRGAQERLALFRGMNPLEYPTRPGTLVISTVPDKSFFEADSRTQGKDRGKYFVYVEPKTGDIYRTEIQEQDRNTPNRVIAVDHALVDGKPNIVFHQDGKPNEFFVEIRYRPEVKEYVDGYATENGHHNVDEIYHLAIGKKISDGKNSEHHFFHRGGNYFENELGKTSTFEDDLKFGWTDRGGYNHFARLEINRKTGNYIGGPIVGFERGLFFDTHTISLYTPSIEATVHVYQAGKALQ